MRSKSQTAWETAARCATLAQEADNSEEREYYSRLHDGGDPTVWIGGIRIDLMPKETDSCAALCFCHAPLGAGETPVAESLAQLNMRKRLPK
jgi:hypothetical protein